MLSKLLLGVALGAVALAAPTARVTETTLPLADEQANAFYFVGNLALAVAYDGGGKVTGRINAYDLTTPAFAWRQEVRVQDTEKNPGGWIMTQTSRNRLLMGNGPLTALDLPTGRLLWTLDCRTAGSVWLERSSFFTDDDILLHGSKDCGDLEHRRLLRVNGATGQVRWQADADVHEYKTPKGVHHDFAVIQEGAASASAMLDSNSESATSALIDMLATGASLPPTQIVIAGERLSAVDYQSGRQNWALKSKPGRWVPLAARGLSFWVDDGKLMAYSTRDGSRQWAYDLDAPWPILIELDTTATSDLLAVTWRNVHRIDRTGRAKWTVKREDETWGQRFTPSFLLLALKGKTYARVDYGTGTIRWSTAIKTDGATRQFDENLSVERSGIVLVAAYDSRSGPYVLTALDAETGQIRWTVDRINKKKIDLYAVVRATQQLVARHDDGPLMELDIQTGAVIGQYAKDLPSRAAGSVRQMNGYRVSYSDKKQLTCSGPDGQLVWERKGELSDNAKLAILDKGVVVWPMQDGTIELIDLATGATLHRTTGNRKPFIGVDVRQGRVLVPHGKTLKVLTVAPGA